MAQFQVLQPETTYTGSPIQALQKGLPKQTQSLCPDCSELIDARIFEDAGKVVMEKHCKNHGDFRDVVYGDVKLYLKMDEWRIKHREEGDPDNERLSRKERASRG